MKPEPPLRIVFDANVFVQAVIRKSGAGFACTERVREGHVRLMMTASIYAEIREALLRMVRNEKYPQVFLSDATSLLTGIQSWAETHPEPPRALALDRDPDDEVYVSLAVATGATLLTTSDKDLLHLMDAETEIGAEFQSRFPDLAIVTPPEFLARVRAMER